MLFLLCRISVGQNIICWMVNSVYTTSCDFNRNERLSILDTTCSLYRNQLDFSLGARLAALVQKVVIFSNLPKFVSILNTPGASG